jgi:RNA polymerase sigma-70 factor, ECF subfamily
MSPRKAEAAQVEALRAGDSAAFERLYAEYSAPIYNLCARVVCDREEAKDLTQDVFITAFNQLRDPAAEPVRKLRPWLYRVATNACYNHLRSRKHLDGGGDAQLEGAASGVDEYQRAETVALVEASLGQLNERYRTALVLKDLQGLEPAEIAEVMEVSRPNADVLVHRARASFKAAFAKLAGDVPAPAALGMVLLPLSLPAALQAMPSFAHPLAPPAHAPVPAPHAPVSHGVHIPGLSHAGPAGIGGLLGKIGAALTTKIGITAAAATLVIGGTVAVKEVQHAHARPWTGTPGNAWQAPSSKWSKQWARWSLYGHWMKHGWPMGWNSGRWSWNGRMGGWSWNMDSGSKWSSSGMTSGSSSWGGGSWTMTMSRSGSSGWSSGSGWSGSGSSKTSGSGGSWSGSSKNGGGGSGGGWNSGSSGSSGAGGWDSGSSGGSGGMSGGW